MKTKKKFLLALAGLAAAFAVYNAVWFAYSQIKFKPYKDAVGYDSFRDMYITFDEEGCYYVVFPPDYLKFTSNLSIGKSVDDAKTGDIVCGLLIWVKANGDYEFGLSLKEITNVDAQSGEVEFTVYNIMMDAEENPVDFLSAEDEEILKKYQEEIHEIYLKAYNMWGIGSAGKEL